MVNTKCGYGKVSFLGSSVVKKPPANAGAVGSIPGSGRSPGEGNGNPLQHFCIGNPTDRGAWQATVHGVAKSQTRLSEHMERSFLLGERGDFLKKSRGCIGRYLRGKTEGEFEKGGDKSEAISGVLQRDAEGMNKWQGGKDRGGR